MPKKTQDVIVIPNRTGEVFDVVGTSVSENYAMTTIAGLTSPVATDWSTSPSADVANQNISATSNVKAILTVYDGIPDGVAKIARNISVFNGPSEPNISPTYETKWTALHQGVSTKFIRMSDGLEHDAATLDPVNASIWNDWKARFKGQFDFSGRPVGTVEIGISTIRAFQFSSGGATFTGFSPIMTHTGETTWKSIGDRKENIVYYTKDTTGATVRESRRGGALYCRLESGNYLSEYFIGTSPSPIISIEHVWVFGSQHYIVVLTAAGYKTFVSAPYPAPIAESQRADFTVHSFLYSQVVLKKYAPATDTPPDPQGEVWLESQRADFTVHSFAYETVVLKKYAPATDTPPDPQGEVWLESQRADFTVHSFAYEAVVLKKYAPATDTPPDPQGEVWLESQRADFSTISLDYIYTPPSPPTTPPAHYPTTVSEGVDSVISAQALTYA